MEHDELLPAEPDHGGHPHGHPQLHLLLHLHEGQVVFENEPKYARFRPKTLFQFGTAQLFMTFLHFLCISTFVLCIASFAYFYEFVISK